MLRYPHTILDGHTHAWTVTAGGIGHVCRHCGIWTRAQVVADVPATTPIYVTPVNRLRIIDALSGAIAIETQSVQLGRRTPRQIRATVLELVALRRGLSANAVRRVSS